MKIIVFSSPKTSENTYLCIDEKTAECVVIDPGAEGGRVIRHLEKEKLALSGILLTHGHCDHIEGVEELKAETNVPVAAHLHEQPVLTDSKVNLSAYMADRPTEIRADRLFNDGDEYRFGETVFTVIHTPGHTPGGVCYYAERDGVIFTGDTLFDRSVGRTDLPLGDWDALVRSIREKLYTLPGHVQVYPGHGQPTDIAREKKHNPHVKGDA